VVYHLGVAVNDFRYLSQEEALYLDWSDPWYSRFDRKALRRRYFAPAAAFIYVENFEVRKEIIFRPKDLQAWVDLGLEDQPVIKADTRDAVRQKAAEFLGKHTPVEIDGRSVIGALDRVHFITRTLRTSGVVELGEDIDINTALLGAIYIYPIESLPQTVTMGWDLFNERISQVPTVASDEAGGLPSYIDSDDPVLKWQNFLTNPSIPAMTTISPPPEPPRIVVPVVSVLCFGLLAILLPIVIRKAKSGNGIPRGSIVVGMVAMLAGIACLPYARASLDSPFAQRPTIKPDEANAVLHGLLQNIYRSFDRREESLVYDRLALSISGDLLADVYLQTRRSMELENQGGARVKVEEVEVLDATEEEALDRPGFAYRCRWNVSGSVGHWGHIHQRTNQYEAVFIVEPIDRTWKITDLDLREEKRSVAGSPR
jgi:hypothetical protein